MPPGPPPPPGPPGDLTKDVKKDQGNKMRNIHVGEVRPRPKPDADTVWNSLPKVNLDLDDLFLHYEEKQVSFIMLIKLILNESEGEENAKTNDGGTES